MPIKPSAAAAALAARPHLQKLNTGRLRVINHCFGPKKNKNGTYESEKNHAANIFVSE